MSESNDGSDSGRTAAAGQGTTVCPQCGSDDVIAIRMTLQRGDKVEFRSCHACECKWWQTAATPTYPSRAIPLDEILARVKPKRSA